MNIIQLLSGIRNPQQLQNMAMQGLQKANPEIASILQSCLSQGQPPATILRQAVEAGKINYQQFTQFKNLVNQYSRFLPFTISKQEMDELESAFNNTYNNGFRF